MHCVQKSTCMLLYNGLLRSRYPILGLRGYGRYHHASFAYRQCGWTSAFVESGQTLPAHDWAGGAGVHLAVVRKASAVEAAR